MIGHKTRLLAKILANTKTTTVPKNIIHDNKKIYLHRPCKEFQGATDNTGYGEIRALPGFLGSKSGLVRVHRAIKYLKAPFPIRCQVDHLCRNRLCCEESHLVVLGPKTHGRVSKKDQKG